MTGVVHHEGRHLAVTAPQGFSGAALHAGIKRKHADLALLFSQTPATVAGTYTQNRLRAPCVDLTEEVVRRRRSARALLVVSGNANVLTGPQCAQDTHTLQQEAAAALGLQADDVLVATTGVIGVPLPMARITSKLGALSAALSRSGGPDVAGAIRTTDTFSKTASGHLTVDGKEVTLGGIAKGSGMIHPNMATMLSFLTSDAAVEPDALQALLSQAVEQSFNRITVDGDTSTNDMVLMFAGGLAQNEPLSPAHPSWPAFSSAVHRICHELAEQIVLDGEGATKLIRVSVAGAATEQEAKAAARTIASSSLVKTAIHGEDPNWGRILAALGRSDAAFDPRKVRLWLGEHLIFSEEAASAQDERPLVNYLSGSRIEIRLALGSGEASATALGCDLSSEYVRINSAYRT